jgi:general secretion pathway protein K
MKRLPDERGIILVIVLWIMTLLSVMAGSFAYSMRTETRLAINRVERAQARALADAGVAYAMLQVLAASQPTLGLPPWPVDRSVREWRFGSGQLRIAVVDAGGLIDLNSADRSLLRGLLAFAGVGAEELEKRLDAIEDWRDPDDLRHPNGAEAAEYRAAGRVTGPKNRPFESVEELQQVLGITPELYKAIAGGLTVYSDNAGVNPALAPELVLRALPGMDAKVVAGFLQARADNAAQGLPPVQLPESGPYLSQSKVGTYHVFVEARLDTGSEAFLEAVVVPASGSTPYRVRARLEGR